MIKAVLSLLVSGVLLVGCGTRAHYYADPVFQTLSAIDSDLESDLRSAARTAGYRLVVHDDPGDALSSSWVESQLATLQNETVVLSPYYSLFAADFAREWSTLRFVAFSTSVSSAPNLTTVSFDRGAAFTRAGELLAEWSRGGEERRVAAIILSSSSAATEELEALAASYGLATGNALVVREFDTTPDREAVRREIRDLVQSGTTGFAVHLGGLNRYAIDILQGEAVAFGTDAAERAESLDGSLIYSVEHPLSSALVQGLRAEPGSTVVVEATVATGGAFLNPQLAPLVEVD